MKTILNFKTHQAKPNMVYERPLVQVYEMETEGAILQASADSSTSIFGNSDDSKW